MFVNMGHVPTLSVAICVAVRLDGVDKTVILVCIINVRLYNYMILVS